MQNHNSEAHACNVRSRCGQCSVARRAKPISRIALPVGVAAGLAILPLVGSAVDPPNVFPFQSGTEIRSADVNDAFQRLYDAVTVLEESPVVVRCSATSGEWNDALPRLDLNECSIPHVSVTTGVDWMFTVPHDGIYSISGHVSSNPSQGLGVGPTSTTTLNIVVDGTLVSRGVGSASGIGVLSVQVVDVLQLSSGQVVYLEAHHDADFAIGLASGRVAIHEVR